MRKISTWDAHRTHHATLEGDISSLARCVGLLRKKATVVLLSLLGVAGCVSPETTQQHHDDMRFSSNSSAKIVRDDPGGSLVKRQNEVASLASSGQKVEISGRCGSSCTIYLGLANSCVHPRAIMDFHGPSRAKSQISTDDFERYSREMAAYYPPALADWFMSTARYRQGENFYTLSGSSVIAMGAKRC